MNMRMLSASWGKADTAAALQTIADDAQLSQYYFGERTRQNRPKHIASTNVALLQGCAAWLKHMQRQHKVVKQALGGRGRAAVYVATPQFSTRQTPLDGRVRWCVAWVYTAGLAGQPPCHAFPEQC
jgi:hypothetical protein